MKNFLITILLLISLTSAGQSGVVRLEFEAAVNSDIYQVVPIGNRGFITFFETKDPAGENSKNWLFSSFDPWFKESWKANMPVVTDAEYQDFVLQDTMLYLFFLDQGKVRQSADNFQVTTINLSNGLTYETKGNLPSESTFVKFLVSGDRLFIALNLKNEQAAVYSVDLNSGPIKEFKLAYADENFIEDIAYDNFHDVLLCNVSNYLSRRQNKMYVLAFDREVNFLYDLEILPVVTGKYLNTARLIISDSTRYTLLGSYGSLASKIPSQNEYFGTESAGVFCTRINNRRQEFMNYYNFTEFKNLRAGANARDYYKMQKRKDRESQEYSLNYEILMHEPEMHDSTLIVMMEAFYPEFRTVSDISYDYWGRPVTHTYNVFDGFRFFNSMLVGFNSKGELAWDNSLEINTNPTWSLNEKTEYFFDGEPVLLFYNDGSKISYRICLGNAELEPFTKMALETSHAGDKITAIGQNRLVHWYGYNFLAYGYHTIQNNLLQDKNERTVFYINKISLE
jgi:hypothetical protein